MSVEENKKIAEADVLCIGPAKLEEKLTYYADDSVVWDSVMRVADYSQTNIATGFDEVKKFFTWLANLPPVKAKVLNTFGEGDKVAVEWQLSAGEGEQRFEILCANIYDFENGKIKGVRMQFDSAYFADLTKNK